MRASRGQSKAVQPVERDERISAWSTELMATTTQLALVLVTRSRLPGVPWSVQCTFSSYPHTHGLTLSRPQLPSPPRPPHFLLDPPLLPPRPRSHVRPRPEPPPSGPCRPLGPRRLRQRPRVEPPPLARRPRRRPATRRRPGRRISPPGAFVSLRSFWPRPRADSRSSSCSSSSRSAGPFSSTLSCVVAPFPPRLHRT